jgi:hypothetical protein
VVSSMMAFQRTMTLLVELPTTSMTSSNPDPTVRVDCWKTNLDMAGVRSLYPVVARSLPEVVTTTWKVHRQWEILPMISWVHEYSESPVTQQRLSHV